MEKFKPVAFYNRVKEELSKVNWSSKEATVKTSVVVLVAVGILTAYLGVCDAVFSRLAALVIG